MGEFLTTGAIASVTWVATEGLDEEGGSGAQGVELWLIDATGRIGAEELIAEGVDADCMVSQEQCDTRLLNTVTSTSAKAVRDFHVPGVSTSTKAALNKICCTLPSSCEHQPLLSLAISLQSLRPLRRLRAVRLAGTPSRYPVSSHPKKNLWSRPRGRRLR